MLYAALTFWLFVIIFAAWGVHSLWSGLLKPRVVNGVLLPGTLVAQLGHVLGLLVTGNPVSNTMLMSDDEKGDPKAAAPDRPRLPIIGPILIGLLPLVACAGGLYASARMLGGSVFSKLGGSAMALPQDLPTTPAAVWALLHSVVDSMQTISDAVGRSDLSYWPTLLFLYLAVCLTVRMAPFEGNQRGAIGAIALTGVVVAILAAVIGPRMRDFVLASWQILSFAVAVLLILLLASLAVRGLVGLVRLLAAGETPARATRSAPASMRRAAA